MDESFCVSSYCCLMSNLRGVFRTCHTHKIWLLSVIRTKSYMYDRVLNTPLRLDIRQQIKSLLKASDWGVVNKYFGTVG